MPRRKKKPIEWTTEEAMKHLFPKKVRDELYRIAHEVDGDNDKSEAGSSSPDKDNTDTA